MALTTHPHLVLMLKKSRAISLLVLCAFMAGFRSNITFTFPNDQYVTCTVYSVLKGSMLVGRVQLKCDGTW